MGEETIRERREKKAEKEVTTAGGDVLMQEGISAPVKASFGDMSVNDTGVCLCSPSEVRMASPPCRGLAPTTTPILQVAFRKCFWILPIVMVRAVL